MNGHAPTAKNPAIAGILSFVIPGVGQFYNDEAGKGILILGSIIAATILLVFGWMLPWSQFAGGMIGFPTRTIWFHHTPQLFFEKFYPVLYLLFCLLMWLFGIFDAIFSALRINKYMAAGFASAQRPPTAPPPQTPQPQKPQQKASFTAQTNETFSQEAQPTMNANSTSTHAMGGQPHPQAPPQEPPRPNKAVKENGMSGKFILGLILFVIGVIFTLEQLDLDYLNFSRIWPFVPLVFGLRLLRDYAEERESGQLILGMIFTFIGAIFFLENWDFLHPVDWLLDHWGLLLCGFAVVLFWQDFIERKHKKNNKG
jgi:TM2 domain-containing membrane protein YozV